MARIHGSHGQVMMDPTGGATSAAVGDLNNWSLDLKRDRVDVTCFGDTTKQSVQGLPGYEGTLAGCWNSANVVLFEVALGDVAALLKLLPSSLEPTFFFTGLAWIDASIEVAADGAVTVGGTFAGAGPWTMEPTGVVLTRGAGERDRVAA